jgi:fatty-acyl-CoA synthase
VSPLAERISSLVDLVGRAGLLDPRRVPTLTAAIARWGPTSAASVAAFALATPNRTAVIDDDGALTFSRLDRQSTRLAQGLHRIGVRRGESIGMACRNHRDFVETTVAAAKAGVGVIYLNTSFARPQMSDVLARERVAALVIDESLLHLVDRAMFDAPIVVADLAGDTGDGSPDLAGTSTMDEIRRMGDRRGPLRASMPVPPVLLTSGTTGTPKGARRGNRVDPTAATGLLDRIPYRHDDVVAITSPLFHAWGLAQLLVAQSLGASVVLSRTFDAESTITRLERDRVSVLAVVPAILQRLLSCPSIDAADLSSLRIVASSGSALPVPVVEDWLERVGPNLYNLYGSTEVGQATLATPDELARHPGTAGRPLPGSVVSILSPDGHEVDPGSIGRIFVGNGSQFDRYTGGGGKEIIGGLMSSGDLGYVSQDGLLFVTGRADEMIVSGGENVFPREVEDLLLAHPSVADAAVVGVDDERFGQRLVAYVVKTPGTRLSATAVKKLVSENLARHKTPRDVYFIDELPRTATGKIRRNRLG